MNNNLQNTLNRLSQSGSHTNPAYNALVQDYTKYHTVFVIEGSIFTLLLMVLSVFLWRHFLRTPETETHRWSFEKKIYFYFGLLSIMVTLSMSLIVMANLSNVLTPQKGFALSLPDLKTTASDTQKAVLYQAVNSWALSGSTHIPSILQNKMQERLSWQLPKAIICSFLLAVFVLLTFRIWQTLIKKSRVHEMKWRLKENALLIAGVIVVPIILLLMIMALANTQASFAPITLTLLYS